MNNERLKYGGRVIYMEGVVVEVDDCSISVDLKGRLGFFKAPKHLKVEIPFHLNLLRHT